MTDQDHAKIVREAKAIAASIDPGNVFRAARKAMLADMTNPVSCDEHMVRIAAEMAAAIALSQHKEPTP